MARGQEISFEDRVAIKTLRKAGYSFGQIANKVSCCTAAAYKVFKTYQQTGNATVRKRTGRPKMFTEREEGVLS